MGELSVGIRGNNGLNHAGVTDQGELVVAPLEYSTPYYISVAASGTPYEVLLGKAGFCFVITGLLLASDKNFGTSVDAQTLTIYEAHPSDIGTSTKTIVQLDLLRNDRITPTGLNIRTSSTVSLVAIGTDSAVDVTIAGYYIPC